MHKHHIKSIDCLSLSIVTFTAWSCVQAQLKAGLWVPDPLLTGVLLPLRRVREKMKKQMVMVPRIITPEISVLVTAFI